LVLFGHLLPPRGLDAGDDAPAREVPVGANPLFGPEISRGVGGCLRAAGQAELGVDPARVVLGRLRADVEATRDLGVAEAVAEKPQHLELALAQPAVTSRAGAALGAEAAEERGRGVGVAARSHRLQLAVGAAGEVDCDRRLRSRETAGQL